MSDGQRTEFLAETRVGVISIAREEGPPLAVPVWYGYRPGGDVVVYVDPGSVKRRLLERARAFSLCAQDETPPYRYVSVQGPVTALDHGITVAELDAMTRRYLDAEATEAYMSTVTPSEIVRVTMRPDRWYAVDQGQ